MGKESDKEKEAKYDRRAFLAVLGVYGVIIVAGAIQSCNNRLRGIETVCHAVGSRAGVECIDRPILKGGDENERK